MDSSVNQIRIANHCSILGHKYILINRFRCYTSIPNARTPGIAHKLDVLKYVLSPLQTFQDQPPVIFGSSQRLRMEPINGVGARF